MFVKRNVFRLGAVITGRSHSQIGLKYGRSNQCRPSLGVRVADFLTSHSMRFILGLGVTGPDLIYSFLRIDPIQLIITFTHPNSMSSTPDTYQRKERQHFRHFFPNVSFITSILFGISASASLTLPGQGSFFGRNETAEAQKNASFFAWSACINGGALVLSLGMQLLQTSPHVLELASSDNATGRLVRQAISYAAWISLLLAVSGMALVAQGLKIVQRNAGLVLQLLLCSFFVPISLFWIVFKVTQTKHKRTLKTKDLENQSPKITPSVDPSGGTESEDTEKSAQADN